MGGEIGQPKNMVFSWCFRGVRKIRLQSKTDIDAELQSSYLFITQEKSTMPVRLHSRGTACILKGTQKNPEVESVCSEQKLGLPPSSI